jgi:hypothetical protein
MGQPDVLVIDDQRTFRFPAVYARTAAEGMSWLAEHEWREVWLDHNLGTGLTIEPVLRLLEERATIGRPFPIGLICVHTSDPAEGDTMVAALTPWYRVRRVVAHSFLASS